jgi:hypothetical protein
MNEKIKSFFLAFNNFKKKGLVLALLFLVIFGLVFSFQPALAQIPGLNCAFWDVPCLTANFFLSIMIKIVVLTVFGIPLLISALFVGIMALILGWIISPDFISLKFTQNPFVNIGLSITKGFANMGFIIFLVVIALATVLRIEEYKAKKTLATLIIVALLINFSPVFCGFIIDASNIVMNYFLSGVTGLTGFGTFLYNAALSVWNSIIMSGFDVWANIAAAMQVVISIVFNFFAGYIFILFSLLFIMRYIMLWIIVIVSPVAFVSYILPVTKRGQSLLSWRKWWEQLISWSIIGIIAGFFLYLGFTMISMINASPGMFVTQPDLSWGGGGLGLMNNILPYLIPLVLLWIAYKETKRTSAWFAGDIIQFTEKIGKTAVTAATMIATAGAGMAVKAAGAAGGRIKGAAGTMASEKKWEDWKGEHKVVGGIMDRPARAMQWAERRKEDVEKKIVAPVKTGIKEDITDPLKKRVKEFKEKHPEFTGYARAAKKGLKATILGRGEKEEEGRELRPEERTLDENGKQYRYKKEVKKEKVPFSPSEREMKIMIMPDRTERTLTEEDLARGYIEEEKISWVKTDQELTEKEIKSGHQINTTMVKKPGIMPAFKDAMKTAVKGLDDAIQSELEERLTTLSAKLTKDLKQIKDLQRKIDNDEDINFEDDIKGLKKVETEYRRFHKDENVATKELDPEVKNAIKKYKIELEEEAEEAQVGLQRFKISDFIPKIHRKKPKKDEPQPPPPTPPPSGPGPDETGEGDSSGGVSPDETG